MAVLVGWVIAAGTVLLVDEEMWSGWIVLGFGLLGFLALLSMVITDRRS